MTTKLQKIASKYQSLEFNENNYFIGGGLSSSSFSSNRHEDAKTDQGKLTEGQAVQLFKKATSLDLSLVKSIIKYAVPNMEWHHAGLLPKQYGGGMKKTYFLNANQIADLAKNWDKYNEEYNNSVEQKLTEQKQADNLKIVRQKFLTKYATRIERVLETPKFFHETLREMNGKYGWFDAKYQNYNLPIYYSGWAFKSEKKYKEFINLK